MFCIMYNNEKIEITYESMDRRPFYRLEIRSTSLLRSHLAAPQYSADVGVTWSIEKHDNQG